MGTLKLGWSGYTLVEMVVTAALIGVISVGIVSVFISTIQGGKTARAQANVKTQGDYAITSIERTLRNAIKFPVCSNSNQTITFEYLGDDGLPVTQAYLFANKEIAATKNGVSQGLVITSGQTANAIEVTEASFVCTQGNSFNPGFVTISMTLHTVGDIRQQTTQQFQTIVTMRNIP